MTRFEQLHQEFDQRGQKLRAATAETRRTAPAPCSDCGGTGWRIRKQEGHRGRLRPSRTVANRRHPARAVEDANATPRDASLETALPVPEHCPMIRCCNCGAELSPREAESFDGLPLSESGMLGHREPEICRAVNRAISAEIMLAIKELEAEGLWETVAKAPESGGDQD